MRFKRNSIRVSSNAVSILLHLLDYFLVKRYSTAIASGHDGEKLLRNLRFIRPDGKITVAAMLLFGKYTQRWLPVMTAKCICFVGNNLGGTQFRDKVNEATTLTLNVLK